MKDIVSIILTAKDIEGFIARCLMSLVNQTYKNLEIVVVDDGSSDKTLEIINSFMTKDKRIKLYCSNSSNKQIARNMGLKNASGDYVYVIDGDDELPLNAVEEFLKTLKEKDVDAVFGSVLQIFPDKIRKERYSPKEGYYFTKDKQNMIDFLAFINSGEFVSKMLVKKEKIDCTFQENILLWDNNLFILRVLKNIEKFYCKDILVYYYYYRQRSNSSMVTLLNENMFLQTKLACPYYLEIAKELFPNDKEMWFYICSIIFIVLSAYIRLAILENKYLDIIEKEINDNFLIKIINYFKPKNNIQNELKNAFLTKNINKIIEIIKNYDKNLEINALPFGFNKSIEFQDMINSSKK